ncbi:alpha/beta fold hydrolase [Actinoplanes sp. NPDC020271]
MPTQRSTTLAIIKDCGHFPWVEQPEAFRAACAAWFEERNVPLS